MITYIRTRRHRPPQCKQCGRFIGRPHRTCGYCGHNPLSHNGDPWAYDRAHGYE